MANTTLQDALTDAGLNPERFAEIIGVDPKTVQRWVAGTTPYRRHRQAIARALEIPEHRLWPETTPPPQPGDAAAGDGLAVAFEDGGHPAAADDEPTAAINEVTGSWAQIGDPTAPYPVPLFANAARQIDLFDGAGDSLLTPGITDTLKDRADHGCHIRILTATPPRQLQPLIGHKHVELRLADTRQGVVVVRADDTMLIPIPVAAPGLPALVQLRRLTDDGIFDRLARHFQTLWDGGATITGPRQLVDIPDRQRASPAPEAPRRWPGQRA